MSNLNEVGERDGWRCWLCDAAVDPNSSVNSDLGPSTDSYAASKAKKGTPTIDRLAHRSCNTSRGKIAPVVAWSKDLFVVDPAPIFESVERLSKKGGREAIARCPSMEDAQAASEWLLDRVSRLAPNTSFKTEITPGGGQFLLKLSAS
ncbi:hypothetical protein [Candidatus Aquiluna sp. UB-MaderosW2red]|uniref:hypothetical protein n=1 Tax=Candidatus Aquiluna sp. UB-MaderosW2red TaxID=1855377 RepID=UPI000875C1CB|nr:hypothetical protein [Candidatus Aquiluna sp. UB-MaderosW2red]SCX15143.1 hypothetical protein SAMN05216534_1615 [Candidatus Aquiluna sp. UB-MaderosW2red]